MRELKLYGQPNVVVALAANKQDREQYRVVSTHEGQAYARENELTYFETSAKTAVNVKQLFVAIANKLPKTQPQPEGEAFPVLPPTPKPAKGCC